MKFKSALLLVLPFAFATACIEEEPPLADTESALSAFDWSSTASLGNSWYGGQVATLNGVTYMVQSGEADENLYWRKRTGPGTWTAPTPIDNHSSTSHVSLAAFNGYLYMVHTNSYGSTSLSRFDPATETWTSAVTLSFTPTVAPALAAFDGRLWLVGASETDYTGSQLWVSTMNTAEVFTPQVTLRGKYATARPSLAVFGNKLYMAYGYNNSIVTMTHAAGAAPVTWSGPSTVKAGVAGAASQGSDPVIAVAGGYLHLLHRRPNSTATWWTYWNQCSWAPEVQFDQVSSTHPLSLTSGGGGLVLVRGALWRLPSHIGYSLYATEYNAPPAPITVPQCGGVVGT